MRAPGALRPRVWAVVAYLLGRQRIPDRQVAEAMDDLFVLISTGAVTRSTPRPPGACVASSPPWWRCCGPAGAARR
ncbi:MAG TPA: hypothetical protein VM142_03470 [Acidimicrobiales bacterium]|nr:hypothetical protein [Acidimicrobiales bacterium]